MAKQHKIKKVEQRVAAKPYDCQCGQDGCQERITIGDRYARFKLVESTFGEYKNYEKCISLHCEWFKKWEDFLK